MSAARTANAHTKKELRLLHLQCDNLGEETECTAPQNKAPERIITPKLVAIVRESKSCDTEWKFND